MPRCSPRLPLRVMRVDAEPRQRRSRVSLREQHRPGRRAAVHSRARRRSKRSEQPAITVQYAIPAYIGDTSPDVTPTMSSSNSAMSMSGPSNPWCPARYPTPATPKHRPVESAAVCGRFVSSNTPERIAEYFAVSEAKLNALPADKIIELRDNGALRQIYAHMNSLAGWEKLMAIAVDKAGKQAQADGGKKKKS